MSRRPLRRVTTLSLSANSYRLPYLQRISAVSITIFIAGQNNRSRLKRLLGVNLAGPGPITKVAETKEEEQQEYQYKPFASTITHHGLSSLPRYLKIGRMNIKKAVFYRLLLLGFIPPFVLNTRQVFRVTN